jgi:hypothetical protein
MAVVTISSSDKTNGYTAYTLSISSKSKEWTTTRRYREFLELDSKLKTVPGYSGGSLPPKGLFGFRHRCNLGSFNADREGGLQEYLTHCCSQTSTLEDVPCLMEFLTQGVGVASTEVGAFNRVDPREKYGLQRPCFMMPKKDIDGDNGIVEVAFGEAEDVNGIEVTVVFKDEDRPNHVEDVVYDAIRKPLFGRSEDIETFTFVRGEGGKFESILFKGTYSGDQNWSCKVPKHMTETVQLSEFAEEKSVSGDARTVIWINVWNHLFGPRNTNPDMEMVMVHDYPCTNATRKKVDSRYKGMITTVA